MYMYIRVLVLFIYYVHRLFVYICSMHIYMKIHVPSILAIGIDKDIQQTNKQPQWLH